MYSITSLLLHHTSPHQVACLAGLSIDGLCLLPMEQASWHERATTASRTLLGAGAGSGQGASALLQVASLSLEPLWSKMPWVSLHGGGILEAEAENYKAS